MGMMEVRRRVMLSMAQSNNRIVTGIINESGSHTLTIPFDEKLSDYIFYVEMTDRGFSSLKASELTRNHVVAFLCKYKFSGETVERHTLVAYYNPSTGGMDTNAIVYPVLYEDKFAISVRPINNASAVVLYENIEYKYTLIKMD